MMSDGRACNENLVQALQRAIVDGDEAAAISLVTQLTKTKTSVNIDVLDPVPVQAREREISIKIYIEDKDIPAADYIPWKVKQSTTIQQLKRMMFDNLGFPPETQTWIVGRRIAADQDTMGRCGVTTSGTSVFLYLESAASVGLDRATFRDRYYRTENDRVPNDTLPDVVYPDYISIRVPDTVPPPPPPPPVPPRDCKANLPVQTEQEIYVYYPDNAERQSQDEAANERVEDIYLHPGPQKQNGWACPACTYNNELTRPGCAMCSTARPEDCQVPENYQASEEEMLRLEREKEVENMTLQAVDTRAELLEPPGERPVHIHRPAARHVRRCTPPEADPVEHDEDDDGLVLVL